MSKYITNVKYDIVDKTKITTLKQARQILQQKAGIKETIFYKSTRHYNNGKITEYTLHFKNGETCTHKYNKIVYYQHLCQLANCNLWDIRKDGKHIGYIVKQN